MREEEDAVIYQYCVRSYSARDQVNLRTCEASYKVIVGSKWLSQGVGRVAKESVYGVVVCLPNGRRHRVACGKTRGNDGLKSIWECLN